MRATEVTCRRGTGWQRLIALGPALATLWLLAGCGPTVGQVSGKVLLNGQPVGGAELRFQSTASQDEVFYGLSRPDGSYSVSYRTYTGLPVGMYRVLITHFALPGGKPLPPGEEGDLLKYDAKTVQTQYLFVQQVTAGQNVLDFELSKGEKGTDE